MISTQQTLMLFLKVIGITVACNMFCISKINDFFLENKFYCATFGSHSFYGNRHDFCKFYSVDPYASS